MTRIQFYVLTAAAIGTGAVGGVFFAFSSFVMPALGRLPGNTGMLAMRQIDQAVLVSSFLPLMFGTLLILLGALAFLPSMKGPAGMWLLSGVLVYAIGSVGVTALFNVPLNQRLAAASTHDLAEWASYLRVWTAWNSLRTLASFASTLCLIVAIATSANEIASRTGQAASAAPAVLEPR